MSDQQKTDETRVGRLAGFDIPRIGMGTMALAIEGRPDRETAIETIHAALDEGVRYLDTAWSYYLPSRPGTGEPEDLGYGEQLVRDALKTWGGPREDVLVATKTGYRRTCEAVPGQAGTSSPDVSHETPSAGGASGRQHLQAAGSRYGWMADSRPETMIRDAKESAGISGWMRLTCCTRTVRTRRCRTPTRSERCAICWMQASSDMPESRA